MIDNKKWQNFLTILGSIGIIVGIFTFIISLIF